MANLYRLRATWSGFPGAPGVTTMYCSSPTTAVPGLRAFFDAVKHIFPTNVAIQVEHTGDIIDDATGELTGTWGESAVASVQGTAQQNYAAPAGCCVTWVTDTVLDGKRVRGRTFLVPIGASSLSTNGTLADSNVTEIDAAAHNMVTLTGGDVFRVWHRPRLASAEGVTPVVTARAGGQAAITDGSVKDKITVLRSRRD